VVAAVGHRDSLGVALGLVVHAAGADGVDVAPVGLALRVLHRVAVHLAGGRQHEPGAGTVREAQRVLGAATANGERLERTAQVVRRRGRAREVGDDIDGTMHLERGRDVGLDEAEPPVTHEIGDIVQVAGRQVIDAHDRITAGDERVAQV
jgi:hypothetical protein